MFNVTLTIKKTKTDAVQDYCDVFGYQETTSNDKGETIPNPESKGAFAYRMLNKQVQDVFRAAEIKKVDAQKLNISEVEVTSK